MTPQPGDYGLVGIRGNVGKAIRVGQWLNGDGFSDFEHAFLYVGGGAVLEAEPGGARLGPLHKYDDVRVAWSNYPLSANQRLAICRAGHGYVGTPYSFLDYGALATHRLHIPAPGLKAYIADTGHMICSQLVDQCYADGQVHLFNDGRWPGYVTPGHLRRFTT